MCASMDVRVHPLVRNLTHQHLLQAQASSSGIPGLLLVNWKYETKVTEIMWQCYKHRDKFGGEDESRGLLVSPRVAPAAQTCCKHSIRH